MYRYGTLNFEISVRVIFLRNFAYAKFRENETLTNDDTMYR